MSGSGTAAKTELVCQLDMPYKSQTETIKRTFTLDKAYPSIRLQEVQTSGSMNGGSAGFFHIGEMQLYSTKRYYIIKNAQAEADALMAAMQPLASEATEEDMQALQKAYDVFMYKVFGVIADGIDEVKTENGKRETEIYDLSGRRVDKVSHKGIYVVNGKKIVKP